MTPWSGGNTHRDFGWTGGFTDWTQISGTWTSGPNERTLDIVLYGGPDFSGEAYFDRVVLEKVGLAPLELTIEGPSVLGFKEVGTFFAEVYAGSGDYRYQWYKKLERSTEWDSLGTGKTQIVRMVGQGFTLRVDVYDNNTKQNASATFPVKYGEKGGDLEDKI